MTVDTFIRIFTVHFLTQTSFDTNIFINLTSFLLFLQCWLHKLAACTIETNERVWKYFLQWFAKTEMLEEAFEILLLKWIWIRILTDHGLTQMRFYPKCYSKTPVPFTQFRTNFNIQWDTQKEPDRLENREV